MPPRSAEALVTTHGDGSDELVDEATLERLQQFDWPRLSRELAFYAAKQAKVRYWGPEGHADRLPRGLQARDLANEAILKVYRGERRWDPDQNPDLLAYLRGVVDSLISALIRSLDHRVSKERVNVDVTDLEDASLNPEEELIEAERVQVAGRVLDGLLRLTDNDPMAKRVLEQIFDGESRPRVIAQNLGCTATEVTNTKKRLDRMVEQLKAPLVSREPELGAS